MTFSGEGNALGQCASAGLAKQHEGRMCEWGETMEEYECHAFVSVGLSAQAILDTLEEGGRVAGRLLPLEVAQVCIMATAAPAAHMRCVAVTARLSVYMMWAVAGQLVVNAAHVRHFQRRISSDCRRHTFCNGV
jgi:hypothetical protein